MSDFTDALRNAIIVSGSSQVIIARSAKLSVCTVNKMFWGDTAKPHKTNAHKLTTVVVQSLNKQIQARLDEIEVLRKAGQELKRAYSDTYKMKENEP